MIRANHVQPGEPSDAAPADFVELDFDARHRRRMAMQSAGGTTFLLDLPKAVALRHGDRLVLEDGRLIEVRATPEELVEITAATPADLIRLAWHLGNRHLPTQLLGDRIRIRRDHVIEEMVERLGGRVVPITAPFDPEGGAYGMGEVHGHDHGGHDHRDGHTRFHPHG